MEIPNDESFPPPNIRCKKLNIYFEMLVHKTRFEEMSKSVDRKRQFQDDQRSVGEPLEQYLH